MQTIIDILNTLSESMGKDVVKQGVEMWQTIIVSKEFLANHPGLEFRNVGYISNGPLTEKELAVLEPPVEASNTDADTDTETETYTDEEWTAIEALHTLAEAVALTAIE